MSLPVLEYSPTSQNQRVAGYEISSEEQPWIFNLENLLDSSEIDDLINAAYRQVFNEQQMIAANRQRPLESQLRNGQITVRDFIRGLVLSDSFRRRNYEPNNNYRFAQMCIQRLLGREVYNEEEKLAWSIVIATKGLQGFVDDLLNSDEYLSNFGYDTVPYQRRRILPQRPQGDLPIARMPRYGKDHLAELRAMGYFKRGSLGNFRWSWQQPPYPAAVRGFGAVITILGALLLSAGVVAVILTAFGIVSI